MNKVSEPSLKERIKNLAKEKKTSVNDLLKKLYLERFLARLAASEFSDKLVFKGGNLLNYYLNIGRQTTDLDFLVTKIRSEEASLRDVFQRIAKISTSDGFELSFVRLEPLVQSHMNYPGFRIILNIKFIEGSLRDNLQIDIGVGDQVDPKSKQIEFLSYKDRPFFEESVSLLVYSPEAIYAEKLETVVSKGSANSRMKDFHDLIIMAREPGLLAIEPLRESITVTFQHRGTSLDLPIEFQETEYTSLNQYWTAHSTVLGEWWNKNNMPLHFKDAVAEVNRFLTSIPLP